MPSPTFRDVLLEFLSKREEITAALKHGPIRLGRHTWLLDHEGYPARCLGSLSKSDGPARDGDQPLELLQRGEGWR